MPTTSDSTPGVRLTSPRDILAVIPPLLGFRPSSDLVILGTVEEFTEEGRSVHKLLVTMRYDLPDQPDEVPSKVARHAVEVLNANQVHLMVAVGYGPAEIVSPLVHALREAAGSSDITLAECMRVQDGRYWSYLCQNPDCCSPEGTAFGENHGQGTTVALLNSQKRVLASRDELVAALAPVTGEAAQSMRTATNRAMERAARIITEAGANGQKAARRAMTGVGLDAVRDAITRSENGNWTPSHDEIAWLTVVLLDLHVRDDAWCRMEPRCREVHLQMWADVTRLAQPGHIAAPASLLAFVAWQSGNGALANVALDRALSDNPQYRMARLLRMVIDSGAPPSLAEIPMTPEEVAASYAELDDGNSAPTEVKMRRSVP